MVDLEKRSITSNVVVIRRWFYKWKKVEAVNFRKGQEIWLLWLDCFITKFRNKWKRGANRSPLGRIGFMHITLFLYNLSVKPSHIRKSFQVTCQHRRSQDFWLGGPKPQITCNDVIRNFQKRNFLWDKDIVEWKIWSRSLLALNQILVKREGKN